MSNSYQSEISKARVNIQLSLHRSKSQQKVELSLKLMVVGDYSNGTDERPVSRITTR
ncbi:putative component of type VI protein secretion system [Klebsiella sp. BIGb0407]|nr:putative component of type VI protein secretion system [Klebsiella sp. BIGb0407]